MYLTRAFLLKQYVSIDELHSTIGDGLGCDRTMASPPMVHVPVLSLTQTETSFEQLPAQKTSAVRKATPSKPTITPTVTPIVTPTLNARSSSEATPRETPSKSFVVESRQTKPNVPLQTTLNVEPSSPKSPESLSSDQAPASEKDLPPLSSAASPELQPSRINDQDIKGSKVTSIFNSENNPLVSKTDNSPDNIATVFSSDGGNKDLGNDFSTDGLTLGGQLEARPTPTPQLVLPFGSSVISADLDGNFIIADQTLVAGGSPITASGINVYLQPSKAAAVIDGSTISVKQARPEPSLSNPPIVLPVGSSRIVADSEGNFIIESQTLVPGGSPITALGKSIYLQPSNAAAIIDGSTVTLQQAPFELSYPSPPIVLSVGSSAIAANLEGNFVIGSQTLIAGGSPVTALGKSIYLQPSGSAAIINGNTVALDQAPPVLTFGSQTFEQEKAGGYIIGSQTLIAGGAPITVAGTPVSLAPSAPALAYGLTTIIHKAQSGALVFGNQVLVPDRTGGYALGSQTLFPGRAPITIGGTALSLAPSASELIVGSKTLTPRPAPSFPTVVIHRVSVPANTASELLIAGQTLVAGAPPISIDGQPVSLAPGKSQVVIGSSTKTLSSADSGLASLILQGFGKIGSDATPTRPKSNTTSPTLPAQYTGSAGLGRYSIGTAWMGLSVFLMGFGVII